MNKPTVKITGRKVYVDGSLFAVITGSSYRNFDGTKEGSYGLQRVDMCDEETIASLAATNADGLVYCRDGEALVEACHGWSYMKDAKSHARYHVLDALGRDCNGEEEAPRVATAEFTYPVAADAKTGDRIAVVMSDADWTALRAIITDHPEVEAKMKAANIMITPLLIEN